MQYRNCIPICLKNVENCGIMDYIFTKGVTDLAENKKEITIIFDTACGGRAFGGHILHLTVRFFHRYF